MVIFSAQAQARSLRIKSSSSNNSIQKAIERAESGDTIFIESGYYKEHGLIVNKPLHLIGQGQVIIDGEHVESIITFTTNHFSLEGIKVINVGKSYIKDYAAIHVSHCDSFKIANNTFEHVFFGLLIEKSHFGLIESNTVSAEAVNEASSGNGIHLWHCSDMIIANNNLFQLRDGIYFEFVTNSEIYGNTSNNNLRYGLHFMFSNNDNYHHNTFKNNGAGVAVMFSKFIEMHHNLFADNWGTASYGLLLKEIYDARIFSNEFTENTVGINVEGTNRIEYSSNVFKRNGWAIKIIGACYSNSFTKNNFLHNSFDLAYNTQLNDNIFNANYWSEYSGYDLNKDGIGDIPYRPVKLFSYIVNRTPEAIVLLRSLFVFIINFSEKVSPVFTPDKLIDQQPQMRAYS